MQIIVKYLIKSITEKKFRTFLIIFAVALAGALFLASTSLSDSLVSLYTEKAKQSIGSAEVMISPGKNSPSSYVSLAPVLKVREKVTYIIPILKGNGLYKIGVGKYESIQLIGMTLEDYNQLNQQPLLERQGEKSFEGRMLIISQKTAKKYHLALGDTLELRIGEGRRKLKIGGIAKPAGLFADESRTPVALIPFDTLSRFFDTDNKPNSIYLKTAEGVSIDALLQEVKALYPRYEVREPIKRDELEESVSWIAMPLLLMSFMVTFMSIFIVYSSFKVITLEKMPIIGTFRSIGASKRMMNRVLFLESLCYGIIGGICALVIGIGVLYTMVWFIGAGELEGFVKMRVALSPIRLMMSFGLSVMVALVSSMLPILKTSQIPIKEIVLGNPTFYKKKKIKKGVWGVVCIVVSLVLPPLANRNTMLIVSSIALMLSIMGMIYVLPTLIKMTAKLAEILFSFFFGNIGILAVKNIKGNKSILNSISLITIGIGILMMIVNISDNVSTGVLDFYAKTFVSDMAITMEGMDKQAARSLLSKVGVEKAYPLYSLYDTNVKEWNEKLISIDSAIGQEFSQHLNYDYIGSQEALLGKINEGRYMIATVILKNRYKLKEGDVLTLEMPEGERRYTVIGFMNTMMNNGNYALMSEKYMKLDTGRKYYTSAYINTQGDPPMVLDRLRENYRDRYFSGRLVTDMTRSNEESNDQMMLMMIAFSILAIIIGIIGVINNLLISFIERKQSLAVLRSVGMSQKQVVRMIFLEAVYSALLGGALGIITGCLMMANVPYMLEGMRSPIPTYLVTNRLWLYVVGAVVITVVASITPASKSSKLNIIEAIKYE